MHYSFATQKVACCLQGAAASLLPQDPAANTEQSWQQAQGMEVWDRFLGASQELQLRNTARFPFSHFLLHFQLTFFFLLPFQSKLFVYKIEESKQPTQIFTPLEGQFPFRIRDLLFITDSPSHFSGRYDEDNKIGPWEGTLWGWVKFRGCWVSYSKYKASKLILWQKYMHSRNIWPTAGLDRDSIDWDFHPVDLDERNWWLLRYYLIIRNLDRSFAAWNPFSLLYWGVGYNI